jgi:GNAT acetyltransferase-like protein
MGGGASRIRSLHRCRRASACLVRGVLHAGRRDRLAPGARRLGRGLATEAARAALAFGFGALGLDEIVAYAASANQASQSVMRKLGMTRDEAGDFDHPRVDETSPLRRQVFYRIARSAHADRI